MTRPSTLAAIAFLCASGVCASQDISSAPRGAIFGATVDNSFRDRLDVNTALSGGLDSEVPAELRQRVPQTGPQSGGYSSMLIVSADYARERRGGSITAQGFTALQYYPGFGGAVSRTHSAGVGATLRTSSVSTLEIGQTADYSPSYFYRLFPSVTPPGIGEPGPAAPDYRVDETQSFANSTQLRFRTGRQSGNRISASVEHSATEFSGGTPRTDLDTLAWRASFARGVSRTGTFSIEYEYRTGEFGYGAQGTEQRLRFGANYSPALSLTRRAQLRFNLAPSAIEIPASATSVAATGTLYKMEGDGAIAYPFLRSWTVGGSYRRGLEYIAVLRDPVFRDAARAELEGLVTERVDLSASAGYVTGASVLQQDDEHFDTYTGTVRGRYSVNRSLAVYAEYLYYYYNLRGQAALAPDLPSVFEQHGIRLGLMLWARPLSR